MWYGSKNTTKYLLAWAFVLCGCVLNAQKGKINTPGKKLTPALTKPAAVPAVKAPDSLPVTAAPAPAGQPTADTIPQGGGDSLINTADTFNIKYSKDSLEGPVKRAAIDSAVFLVKQKQFILYGKAKTSYLKNDVEGHLIRLDNETNIMYAYGKPDSAGLRIDEPVKLKTGEQEVRADSVKYNVKTGKGVSNNSRTQDQELYFSSQLTKLMSDRKTSYGFNNLFTTCNLDTPHFAFHAKRIKLVNEEVAVSGFTNPEFEGVPIPAGIPFGIYPLKKGRHSGLLPPTFAANEDLGLGLEGLGYYKVISDYWDVMVRTNLYSYGSWNLIVTPNYRKRYKYSGSFNINIQNTKFNFKGDADFRQNRSFNVGWTHSADTRARPGVTFSANVNAGKSSFNQFNPNNPFRNISNQMYSSISWSKTWTDKPYNITVTANHQQNTLNQSVNLNLPDIGFTVQTLYPFQRKEFVGAPKWYEKLGIAYNGNLRSQMAFRDTDPIGIILKTLVDTFQWGASHNIPITLSLPPAGPIQISPSVTYEERSYGQKILREWNDVTKRVDTSIRKGVYQARQMSFGFSIATAVYGTFKFKALKTKKPGLMAIRHVIRPSIGINYKPDMAKQFYYDLKVDTNNRFVRVSTLDGNIYSPFGEGRFGGMSFGVDNNLEMKVQKKDTSGEDKGQKKYKLIDGFGFTSSFNFLADSFKLAPFSIYVRTSFADGKINVTGGATMDPYQLRPDGERSKRYTWQDSKFSLASLGRFTGANISVSTQLRGGEKKDKTAQQDDSPAGQFGHMGGDMTPEEQLRMSEYVRAHPAEFADFNIPWNLGLSFAMTVARVRQPDYSFKTDIFANVNFNGDFNLTPKWKVGANGFFDVKTREIQQFQMFITREMHCWQLAINVVPVGAFRSFNITINPKAGLLRDLRINRNRFFYEQ
jgi:LPS-assembly protein